MKKIIYVGKTYNSGSLLAACLSHRGKKKTKVLAVKGRFHVLERDATVILEKTEIPGYLEKIGFCIKKQKKTPVFPL